MCTHPECSVFANNSILSGFNYQMKAAAGRIWCCDPGVETVSRPLLYIFHNVSGAVWTADGVAGKRIWEGTEIISELTDTEQQVRIVSTSLYICGASWISWKFWVLVQKFLAEHSLNWDFSLWNSEQTSIFRVRKSLKFEVSGMHYHYCCMLWVLSTDCSGQLYLFSCEKWKNQT